MAKYVQGRGPYFVQVPFELLQDPRVDAVAVGVYCALKMYADFGEATGSRVSDRQAAKMAGCSERTLRERRTKLQECGWIDWEQVPGRPNHYTVHSSLPSSESAANPAPPAENPSDFNENDTPAGNAGVNRTQSGDPGRSRRGGRQEAPGYPNSEKSPGNPAAGAENSGDSYEGTPAGAADDRYDREPYTETTSGAVAPGAAEGVEVSWSAQAVDVWVEEMKGPASGGRIGKALKPLVESYGPEEVLFWWRRYLHRMVKDGRAAFATPHDFASRYGLHKQNGGAASNGKGGSRKRPTAQDYGPGNTEMPRWKR